MFRYPLVAKEDIIIVRNVHGNPHNNTVAMNTATALKGRGDFDGDHNVLLPSEEFPAMIEYIRGLHTQGWESEEHLANKVRKSESDWEDLARVCVESSESGIGLTSFALSSAIARGRHDLAKKLEVVLQDAVDSLKYDLKPDMKVVMEALSQVTPPEWLLDRNSREAFRSRPTVIGHSMDSVHAMVKFVNGLWEEPEYRSARPSCYRDVFPLTDAGVDLVGPARGILKGYAEDIALALKEDDVDEAMSNVVSKYRAWADSLDPEDKEDWASVIWHVAHSSRNSTASLPFLIFSEEVISQLSSREVAHEFTVVGLKYGDFGEKQLQYLNGRKRKFELTEVMVDGIPRVGISVQGHLLGVVVVDDMNKRLPKEGKLHFQWNGSGAVKVW